MLYIFRLIVTVIYSILVCVFGSIYCLFSPRNPKHVATFGHMFGRLAPLFGLKVECRKPADAENYGNAIYIANHQNNYDMVTAANIVQPPKRIAPLRQWLTILKSVVFLSGCSLKVRVAGDAVCCRLKPARFMRLSRLVCRSFLSAFPTPLTKSI